MLPTLTQLGKGTSTFLRYEDGKLYYRAEWWDQTTTPFPTRHDFEFPIDTTDAGGGEFLPHDKTLRFMRWAGQELRRRQFADKLQATGNQCMGCQAGWARSRAAYSQTYIHSVDGGYAGEIVACTCDGDGA